MNNFLRPVLFAALSFVCIAAVHARSPEETLVAFVSAVQEEGLVASVRFMHPEEMATFRSELEPEIVKRITSSRTRQQFSAFTDPYNPKQIRPFRDDADFVAVFIKWLSTSGMAGVTTFENAKVTPLGSVMENDLRHVVARFTYTVNEQTREHVSVTSMKMSGGQPLLLLLPELRSVAGLVRQGR